jgi:hypothetical protein
MTVRAACVRDCSENPFAFSAKDCSEKPDPAFLEAGKRQKKESGAALV